jgi:hypothetical protein
MRSVLCFTILLLVGVVLVFGSNPASSCTDWDEDGVCATSDCNDFNPSVGYNGDDDGDGVTICQGDCDDSDPSNLNKCAGNMFQMYPVFYNPPDQPCQQGYTVQYSYHYCRYELINGAWVWKCDTQPFFQFTTNYLRDCSPW